MAEVPDFAWDIERLQRSHERGSFDCGKAALNDWLRRIAGQHERRDLARTYVAVRPGELTVLGYYALSTHQVTYEAMPQDQAKGLPTSDVPAILLGRLAVDKTVQGVGLGRHLLIDALRRASHISEHVGVRAVEVHAIDDEARRFYLKCGFVPLLDDHLQFLPLHVIRKLDLPPR